MSTRRRVPLRRSVGLWAFRGGVIFLGLAFVALMGRLPSRHPASFRIGDLGSHHPRNPRSSRHLLAAGRLSVPRTSGALRPWHAGLRVQDAAAQAARPELGTPGDLPARARVELSSPEYLQLYRDPHRQTSPPA